MSINKLRNSEIIMKLNKYAKFNIYLLIIEKLYRLVSYNKLKVFYPYRFETLYIHPYFKSIYQFPPIKYCNKKNANLYHWVTGPQITDDKPYIIEPIDHPLSPCYEYEPINALKKRNYVEKIYD